jgi:hypothetical protein
MFNQFSSTLSKIGQGISSGISNVADVLSGAKFAGTTTKALIGDFTNKAASAANILKTNLEYLPKEIPRQIKRAGAANIIESGLKPFEQKVGSIKGVGGENEALPKVVAGLPRTLLGFVGLSPEAIRENESTQKVIQTKLGVSPTESNFGFKLEKIPDNVLKQKLTPDEYTKVRGYMSSKILNIGGLTAGVEAKGFGNASNKFTGAFDQKPRFEISDLSAKIKTSKLGQAVNEGITRLGNILDHKGLFDNYPHFKDLRINFGATEMGSKAQFDPNTFSITVNKDLSRGDLRSSILHEVQHAIQEVEGFAKGGLPKDASPEASRIYKNLAGEIEARAVQAREGMTAAQRKATPFFEDIMKRENINPSEVKTNFTPTTAGSVENAPQVASPAVEKVRTAIQEATTVRPGLESEISSARTQRAAKVADILEKNPTEAGFREALSQLKGPLAENQSRFEGIRNKLDQTDVDNLAKQINESPKLNTFEKISAWDGFNKLLTGEIPEPAQLLKLQDVFGQELVKDVLEKRASGISLKGLVMEAVNIPRALITSADMSAPFRQSILFTLSLSKLPVTSKSFVRMFKDAFSPSSYQQFFDQLPQRPLYNVMKDSGLYIANPNTAHLVEKEENFMTNYGKQIPVLGPLLDKTLGKVIRFSERAYTSYLNNVRVGVFESLANKFIKDDLTPETDAKVFKDLAGFVNAGTGRGGLGPLEKYAAELNTAFFSPRLMASRIQFMNPKWYANQSPQVRREAIKSFAEFIGTGATILGMVKLVGGKNVRVESDPRSSDWGKIRVGHTTWDVWGGFQQWARFFTQMATGQRKSVSTGQIHNLSAKEFPFETRLDVAERFFRGKLSPILGLGLEAVDGQKLYGGDLDVTEEAVTNIVPLYIQDTLNAIKDIGPEALFTVGVPGFFGVGTQTFTPTPKKSTSKKKTTKAKAGF